MARCFEVGLCFLARPDISPQSSNNHVSHDRPATAFNHSQAVTSESLHTPPPRLPRTFRLVVALLVLACALAHLIDASAVIALDMRHTEGRDWHRLFRLMGSFTAWLLIAAGYWFHDHANRHNSTLYATHRLGPAPWSRSLFLLACVASAGLIAEGLKLVIRRDRPDARLNLDQTLSQSLPATFDYHWSKGAGSMSEFFASSDLGIPSSHAAAAFGGALALAILHPRLWVPALALASGCASTRLLARDHYVSDVIAGAAVGLIVAAVVFRLTCHRSSSSDFEGMRT